MRALVLTAAGRRISLASRPIPDTAPGEALIRVTLAGICSTDLELAKGYMGFEGTLGHEFVGAVEKAPDNEWLTGKRVTGEINLPCRACPACIAGMGNHCPNRSVLGIMNKDGAFADYLTLPVGNLHVIPENVSDRAAVFTEPLAAAYRVLEQTQVTGQTRAAVLGVGRLGQLVARALASEGAHVTAIGRSGRKLALLQGLVAATVNESQIPPETRFDLVVECTGSPDGLNKAINLVRPCGTIVLKSTTATPAALDTNRLVIDEIKVIGSRCGPFGKALQALERGDVDVAPLVSDVINLDNGAEAMRAAALPGAVKVLLEIN